MSVISVLEPVPNRIRTLIRILAAAGPLERDELTAYMTPQGQGKPDQVRNIVREAVRMHLLEERDGAFSLSPGLRSRDVNDDAWFVNFVDDALFGRPLEDDNKPVAFAMAWLLTRSPLQGIEWNGEFTTLMLSDLEGDDTYDVTNESRSAMLAYWARFIGYAEALGSTSSLVVPDPTRAIERRLNRVFGADASLTMPVFLERLAMLAPLLEGGTTRTQVEARLRRKREKTTLSQATSLALLRLERRQVLALTSPSDAEMRLLDIGYDGVRRVSHVTRIARSA